MLVMVLVVEEVVGGAWGGEWEVLEIVVSEVMKLVKSTPLKSLKSSEGSIAICEGAVTGSAEDMKGLGLWFGDSMNCCCGEAPGFSATTGAPPPPFMFIKGEPPFVIEYESLVQPSLPTGEVGRRLVV